MGFLLHFTLDVLTDTSALYVYQNGVFLQTVSYAAGTVTMPVRGAVNYQADTSLDEAIATGQEWVHEIEKRLNPTRTMVLTEKFHREIDYKPSQQEITMEFKYGNDKISFTWTKSSNNVLADAIPSPITIPHRLYKEYVQLLSEFVHYTKEYRKL